MRAKVFIGALALALAAGVGAQAPAQAAVPPAPTGVTATATGASGTVLVDWTGNMADDTYVATSSPGNFSCTVSDVVGDDSCIVTGLTNGSEYSFTVTAINQDGSATSAPSAPVMPATNPTAPASVTVVSGSTRAYVSWAAPTDTGGPGILRYNVSTAPSSGGCTVNSVAPATTPVTNCVITGLTTDSSYTVWVTATNRSSFTSARSASAFANPTAGAGVPAAPTSVTAVMTGPTSDDTGTANVSWTAPAAVPGFPVTSYSVISRTGDDTATVCTVNIVAPATAPLTSCTTSKTLRDDSVYTFTVTATNDNGTSVASAASNSVTPYPGSQVPGKPGSIVAVAGPEQVVLTWAQPSSPTAILGYEAVYVSPPGVANTVACSTVSALTCTVSGLTSGTSYTFKVRARNSVGWGQFSDTSEAATPLPASTPSAPRTVTAVGGAGSATVSWAAPVSDGGSAITSYTVTGSPSGTCTVSGLTCTITGLAAGSYTFTVTARNANGAGATSAPAGATVTGTAPGAPTAVVATAGNAQATVSWTAPASVGSSPITAYTVTSQASLVGTPVRTCTTTIVSPATTPPLTCTVANLVNGVSYTFTVTATNTAGTGAASAASNAITPNGAVPGAPTNVVATVGNAQATVTWTAPASIGGSAITGYTVTSQSTLLGTPVRTCSTSIVAPATTPPLTCTVANLINGVTYTFTVTATNSGGTGAASAASNAVTPPGVRVPGAPTGVRAVAGDARAEVTWAAPTDNGGQAITGYTVTSVPGGQTCSTTGTLACTVTGLTNGQAYVFTVTARNATGVGPASGISNEVTPVGERSILIVGARGTGSEDNMVFVDGITEGLVGRQVTPYFRFPGQSGFTAGTGTRTVDANGDFAWQRKTGKRIVVEFRTTDVTSNRVVIAAR